MFTRERIAVVSVVNDLVSDHRVYKTCQALAESGYQVTLIGRKLRNSPAIPNWPFKAIRMRLLINKGPLFYLFFNLRLFLKLLNTRSNLLYANDLDTLLPNYLVSRLKSIPLIYDSHELFCDVPELLNSPLKRRIWQWLEKRIVPKLKHCITVNESIAKIFSEKYKVPFTVVRNIPSAIDTGYIKFRSDLRLPHNKKIILLQGAGINIERGAEELVEAIALVEDAILLIIGSGDVWQLLEEKIGQLELTGKIMMIQRLPKAELMHYTANADLGISIDKNTNLNYYYSLPNKIFDYIQAGVPILASRLPEIEKIISGYDIGDFIENHAPEHIALKLNEMLNSPRLMEYRQNTERAKNELTWDKEKIKLLEVIRNAGSVVED